MTSAILLGRLPEKSWVTRIGATYITVQRVCDESGTGGIEPVVPGEEGQRIWQVRLTPNIQGGEVTQLVLVMRNITERKERERRLNAIFNQTFQFTDCWSLTGQLSRQMRRPLNSAVLTRKTLSASRFGRLIGGRTTTGKRSGMRSIVLQQVSSPGLRLRRKAVRNLRLSIFRPDR